MMCVSEVRAMAFKNAVEVGNWVPFSWVVRGDVGLNIGDARSRLGIVITLHKAGTYLPIAICVYLWSHLL